VSADVVRTKKEFDHWLGLALACNAKAKAAKRKAAKAK
jgi:hypothetical protein